jgi:hypothetical protein
MAGIDFGFELEEKDYSFLDDMVAGGISDDLTPRSGDISVDDNNDYSLKNTVETSQEVQEILNFIDNI